MKNYLTIHNAGWLVTVIISIIMINSGVSKLIGFNNFIINFIKIKTPDYRILIGNTEILSVILYIFPKTSLIGAIVINTIMGVALFAQITFLDNNEVLVPINIIALTWLGLTLRK